MNEPATGIENNLHAYVDDQLDSHERGRVEAILQTDTTLAAQVVEWSKQNAALRAAFGAVAGEPIPARLQPQSIAAKRSGWMQSLTRIAASLMLLGSGALAGWFAHDRFAAPSELELAQASDLVASALAAHRVYTVEVRHPVEVTANEEEHLVKWLSKRLGAPLVAPDLTMNGFSLVGGRLLPSGSGAVAAQFMYENAQGQRITLYLTGNLDRHDTSFRMAEADGINVFYWLDGPLGVAVAGPLERDALMRLVRVAYEQIDRRLQEM